MGWVNRFWSYVDQSDASNCWNWLGAKTQGYGSLTIRRGDVKRAHRLAYILEYGDIPDGMVVRHKCDNPSCVNPDHLELGTHQDNSNDMVARGRHNAQKATHCKNGHIKSDENQLETKRGFICKICRQQQRARAKAKYKEQRGEKFNKHEKKIRTHCKHGHNLTHENIYTRPDGYSECRICRVDRVNRWKKHNG